MSNLTTYSLYDNLEKGYFSPLICSGMKSQVSRNADSHPAFFAMYNMETTEIVAFYQVLFTGHTSCLVHSLMGVKV